MSQKKEQQITPKVRYRLRANEKDAVRQNRKERKSPYRTEFMRDRDRVLYSAAFRRLSGKAQVFIAGEDEQKRTRLTHTLEVSQIARSIAEPLKLDVNLVEAIALGHDLGHTPFGHAGERILHEIMTNHKNNPLEMSCPLDGEHYREEFKPYLGFKHNLQGLAVAMGLEKNHEDFGLNLTNYTLYGIQAHSSRTYKPGKVCNHDELGYYDAFLEAGCRAGAGKWAWSLESLLVAEADEIAQHHHDVEDAIYGGLVTPQEVVAIIKKHFGKSILVGNLSPEEKAMWKNPKNCDLGKFTAMISRILVNTLVTRLTASAAAWINAIGDEMVEINGVKKKLTAENVPAYLASRDEEDETIKAIFSYSYPKVDDGFAARNKAFAGEICQRVLSSHDIQKNDAKGQYIIRKIFQAYYHTPQQLPDGCVFEFLTEYHNLREKSGLPWRNLPGNEGYVEVESEKKLRDRANREGVGSVRDTFAKLFRNREDKAVMEELLLMRTICNHIASMTDAGARKTYQDFYA